MFWKSVVGKLWVTIVFLVCFVLAFLTILLTGYFETYYTKIAERDGKEQALHIAALIDEDPSSQLPYYIAKNSPADMTVSILRENQGVWHSSEKKESQISVEEFKKDDVFSKVITEKKIVLQLVEKENELLHSANKRESMMVAVPLQEEGAVVIVHSLTQAYVTSGKMTNFILIAAMFAVILTTIFSFFLSTRITAPLRKMREMSLQLAKGNFDSTVPIISNDEIGELAQSFNEMGKNLQFNITALKEEKEQLSSILSSMADGVMTLNQYGEVVMTNPPADRLMALWYQEEYHKPDSHRQSPRELLHLFRKVVEQETQQTVEIKLAKGNWVIIMTPLYDQTKVRGVVAVLRDMTEERLLDKMRKDFIANVSHELRTPIAMLQGYSEAILDDIAATEEEKKELVQIIYDESLRMNRLVNELLDLARMESGNIQLHVEEVDMQEFVKKIARKFQGLAKEKEIILETAMPHDIDCYLFDLDKIEQVLTNLIDNAMRYTRPNGTVQLIIEKAETTLQITVKDTGVGIMEEDLPFVFERFYKADKARTRGISGGTGLGLAIAKNIVRAHGGEIQVNSVYGQWTAFTISLPDR